MKRINILLVAAAFTSITSLGTHQVIAHNNKQTNEIKSMTLQRVQDQRGIEDLRKQIAFYENTLATERQAKQKLEVEKREVAVHAAAVETTLQTQITDLKKTIADKDGEIASFTFGRGSGKGTELNLYVPGNCTWYVKERRPDIGGQWGDAKQWLLSAQRAGYGVGRVAVKGSIGVDLGGPYGHVVYVEAVNGDGTVSLSEMNYEGLGIVSQRIANAASFTYIY
jgi:surface antigen